MSPISPERWRALSPYLDQALELAADQRGDWLRGISARDAALASDLQAMLTQHDVVHEEKFMDRALLDPRSALAPSMAGQVLGAYRVVSQIGEGGSGNVWLAELVDLKFFCGFSFAEIGAMRNVSERTVQRDWNKARLFLHDTLREP